MKQIAKFLTIAALVLAGAIAINCTQQEQTTPRTITQTITVSLDEGPAGTRAVDPATGSKTFTTSDRIAVLYRIANHPGMVNYCAYSNSCTVSTDGKKATFTVTLEDPVENSPIRIIYPSDRVASFDLDVEFNFSDDEITLDLVDCRPNGSTASYIDSLLEAATFDGTLNGTNLPAEVWLRNRVAFLALTVKNSTGTANINDITHLFISDGKHTYNASPEPPATTLENDVPHYVAIYPVAPTDTLTIIAKDNIGKRYGKIITGKTLEQSNLYPVTVMMNEQINLAAFTDTYTANDGDILYGCFNQGDGHGVINIPDGATVMLAGVNGASGQDNKETYIKCEGSAHIILSPISSISGGNCLNAPSGSNDSAIYVPQGKTLSISGNGRLHATSSGGAAIGAGKNLPCGNIIISGGSITAETTEPSSAAIGAGGSAAATSGSIVITKDIRNLDISGNYFISNGSGNYSAVTIDGKTGPSGFSFEDSTTQFPHFRSHLLSVTRWLLFK